MIVKFWIDGRRVERSPKAAASKSNVARDRRIRDPVDEHAAVREARHCGHDEHRGGRQAEGVHSRRNPISEIAVPFAYLLQCAACRLKRSVWWKRKVSSARLKLRTRWS